MSDIAKKKIVCYSTRMDDLKTIETKPKAALNSIKKFLKDRQFLTVCHNNPPGSTLNGLHLHVVCGIAPDAKAAKSVSEDNIYRAMRKACLASGIMVKSKKIAEEKVINVMGYLKKDCLPGENRIYMGTNARWLASQYASASPAANEMPQTYMTEDDSNGFDDAFEEEGDDWGLKCPTDGGGEKDEWAEDFQQEDDWSEMPQVQKRVREVEVNNAEPPTKKSKGCNDLEFLIDCMTETGETTFLGIFGALGRDDQQLKNLFAKQGSQQLILKAASLYKAPIRRVGLWERLETFVGQAGLTAEESFEFVYEWCNEQGINHFHFFGAMTGLLMGALPDKNCVILHGDSGAGKSMLALKSFMQLGHDSVGQVVNAEGQFQFSDCIDKSLIIMDECIVSVANVETCKQLMGGDECKVGVKYKDSEVVKKTPMIMCGNSLPWSQVPNAISPMKRRSIVFRGLAKTSVFNACQPGDILHPGLWKVAFDRQSQQTWEAVWHLINSDEPIDDPWTFANLDMEVQIIE